MLNIKTFICNLLSENTYVVSDETQECVIIDCGAYYEEEREAITRYIDEKQLKPVHLLATHLPLTVTSTIISASTPFSRNMG